MSLKQVEWSGSPIKKYQLNQGGDVVNTLKEAGVKSRFKPWRAVFAIAVGGARKDSCTFTDSFGDDTIVDSDGAGSLFADGSSTALNGGKKIGENVWESTDGVYRYLLFSRGGGNDLVIGRGSKALAPVFAANWV